jgi:hypothetical protein
MYRREREREEDIEKNIKRENISREKGKREEEIGYEIESCTGTTFCTRNRTDYFFYARIRPDPTRMHPDPNRTE